MYSNKKPRASQARGFFMLETIHEKKLKEKF